jgi:hypothetical protein
LNRYSGSDLEIEDDYIALEHKCLVPSKEHMLLIKKTREARAMPYTMVQVIDTAFDDSSTFGNDLGTFDSTGYQTPPLDDRGALIGSQFSPLR